MAIAEDCGNRHDEPRGSAKQTLVNSSRHISQGRISVIRRELDERLDEAGDSSEQPDERANIGDCNEETKVALQTPHFKLPGFLRDFAKFVLRQIVTDERRMDDSCDRNERCLAFRSRFGEIPIADQVRKTLQEFSQINGGAVVVENALKKNGDGNNATKQDEPHQRPSLLHVVDHPRLIDELCSRCKVLGKGESCTERFSVSVFFGVEHSIRRAAVSCCDCRRSETLPPLQGGAVWMAGFPGVSPRAQSHRPSGASSTGQVHTIFHCRSEAVSRSAGAGLNSVPMSA